MGNSASKRLGDYCQLRNGYAFKSGDFVDDGISVVRISDIQDRGISLSKAVSVKPKDEFEKFLVRKGDILIAMSGATTGKYGVFDSDQMAYQNQRVGCFVVRDKSQLDSKFLYFLISQLKAKIESEAYGGAQPNILSSKIEDYKIHLPSIQDQIRIANILSKAEALINQRKESLRLLDELLKSTFLEMFGTLTNPKYETDRLDNLSLKITDGTHQSPKFTESGIPFILVSNIVDNEIVYDTSKFITEEEYNELIKRTPIEIGDILYTTVGSYGNAALIKSTKRFCFQRHIGYIKPDKAKINNTYLFGAMKSSFVRTQVDKAVKGVAQLTLNLSELKKIKIPVPPLKLQTEFAHIVEKTEALKVHYQTSLQELKNLYGSLSQKAFKGELSFKEVASSFTNVMEDKLAMAAEPMEKYGKTKKRFS